MAKAVGIDLGTTNSVVAFLEGGVAVVIPNAEGDRTTPSVVAFAADGEVLVGDVAKRQAITNPSRTFRSAKREMGTSWLSEQVDGKQYTAQEISARTLMKLKRDAEAYCGDEVTQAVITVPAYFDDAQRTATKEAGLIAGLEVLRIVNEPTAAALAYGLDHGTDDETVLVFDLGGGTLDVSVLEIADGMFAVKATQGDTRLGGDDWDQRIIDWLVQRFNAGHGVDLSLDNMATQRLKEAAERAKIELSQVQTAQIHLPFITATLEGPLHLDEQLSRSKFEEMTADLIERCRVPFEQALADANLSKGQLDHVILVGGSTRMPAVAELVLSLTGREPSRSVNADEVVAVGAAVQAGVLKGEVSDVLLLDVTPLSLGVETVGGVMTTLIARNTTIPTVRTEVFSTAADLQLFVDVHVLQGEREMAADNKTLGKFQLVELAPVAAGVPKIAVTFDIDANGIVHVSATDQASGLAQSMTISGQSDLGADDIARMITDAETHGDEDAARRAVAEVRNGANPVIAQAERMLGVHCFAPDAERAGVVASLAVLRSVFDGADAQAIIDASQHLRSMVEQMTLTLGETTTSETAAANEVTPATLPVEPAFEMVESAEADAADMALDVSSGDLVRTNDTPIADDVVAERATPPPAATLFDSAVSSSEPELEPELEPVAAFGDEPGVARDAVRQDGAHIDTNDEASGDTAPAGSEAVSDDGGEPLTEVVYPDKSADDIDDDDHHHGGTGGDDEAGHGEVGDNGGFDDRADEERTYDGMFDDDLAGGELTDAGMFDDELSDFGRAEDEQAGDELAEVEAPAADDLVDDDDAF